MFCRNCGKELSDNSEYCMNCGARPYAGSNHCQACGAPTNPLAEVCLKCGAKLTHLSPDVSPKSRLALTLLAWFLGGLGIHRFYAGRIGTAITMLVLEIVGWCCYAGAFVSMIVWGSSSYNYGEFSDFTIPSIVLFVFSGILLAGVGIWVFIDFIYAIIGKFKDKQGKLISRWQ